LENLKGSVHLEDLGVDGKTMLEVVGWKHLAQDRDQWTVVVNEPSGSMKGGDFLD
jgi:hypothetical protein